MHGIGIGILDMGSVFLGSRSSWSTAQESVNLLLAFVYKARKDEGDDWPSLGIDWGTREKRSVRFGNGLAQLGQRGL